MNKEQLIKLWLSTGHCKHPEEHYEISEPLNCGVKITDCGICRERMDLVYIQ